MFSELRQYDVAPGKLPALLDRFGSVVDVIEKDGFRADARVATYPRGCGSGAKASSPSARTGVSTRRTIMRRRCS